MSRKERLELIKNIEESGNSKVLVYFTGDRRPFPSQIAEDAVLPLYKHLLALEEAEPNLPIMVLNLENFSRVKKLTRSLWN